MLKRSKKAKRKSEAKKRSKKAKQKSEAKKRLNFITEL
jgi:hypothetical protein